MFPFSGWGGFEIRLARRRAHPCDEQVVANTCPFPLFFHVKVPDSILWVGASHGDQAGTRPEITDRWCSTKAAIRGRGWGDPTQLYKYNGNLLHLCTFTSLELSPAAQISAGGKLLAACGNAKSAGGNSLSQRVAEVVRRQKEKGCYNICPTDSFPIASVTSEPTSLQDRPHIHLNPSHHHFSAGL